MGSDEYEALSRVREHARTDATQAKAGPVAGDDYAATWRKMRIIGWMPVGAWAAYLPGKALAEAIGSELAAVVWTVWVVVGFVLGIVVPMCLDCPRCHRAFVDLRHGFFFCVRCQHCGLPFGAERDPDGGGD